MEDKKLTPLEKYILEQREQMDQVEPLNEEELWSGLEIRDSRFEKGEGRFEKGEGRFEMEDERDSHHPSPNHPSTLYPLPSTNKWHISIGRNWRWSIAASIVLAIGLYFLIPKQEEAADLVALSEFFPEFAEQEADYQQLIAQKEDALKLEELDKAAFSEIFKELKLLEEIHKEYLQDLPHYEKNDRLVNTLMRYYERKIKILERLSREIEKKKVNHEKVTQEQQI